jgi:endonuclease YncB( thermonuclease family)
VKLAAIAALALLATPAAAETIAGRARVIDGDTIEVRHTRIRLHGIDAPELHQECHRKAAAVALVYPCGREARAALERIIGAGEVTCEGRDRDRYGRTVATCTARGNDIGREMVREGWAVAFTRYSRTYVADESEARAAGRGIWAGAFEIPADWRRQHEHR